MDLILRKVFTLLFIFLCKCICKIINYCANLYLVFKNLVKYLKLFEFRPMSGLRRLKFFGWNSQKMALLPITLSHAETSIFFSRVVVIVFFVTFRRLL